MKYNESAGDSEQLLTGEAKAAHAGDVLFAAHPAKLGAGDIDETEFKCGTPATPASTHQLFIRAPLYSQLRRCTAL